MNFTTNNIFILLYSFLLKINFRGKSKIINLCRYLIPNEITLKDKCSKVKFILDRDDAITKIILKQKSYELQSVLRGKEILKNYKGVFIDIGANFGLYTCLIGSYASKTIALDASPIAMTRLLKNLKANNFSQNIIPILALIDSSHDILMFRHDYNNLGKSRIKDDIQNIDMFIPTCSINTILEKFILENEKIALIKIDIEGSELDTFLNYNFDRFNPQNIIMEYEPLNNNKIDSILDILKSKGFVPFNIDGSLFELTPKIEYNLWFKQKDNNLK